MPQDRSANRQDGPHKNHGIPQDKKEGKDKKIRAHGPVKQDEPHKKHGVPADKQEPQNEEGEEDSQDFGGMQGAENFRKNLGCGG